MKSVSNIEFSSASPHNLGEAPKSHQMIYNPNPKSEMEGIYGDELQHPGDR